MTSTTLEAGDDLPLTVPRLLRRQAEVHGARDLLVCDDARLTYADAERRSGLLARGLLAAGAGKGSHVSVLYPSGVEFVVAALAAARIGAVLVPISSFSTADEIRWLLANGDAGFLIAASRFRSHDYVRLLAAALPDLNLAAKPPLRMADAPLLRRVWIDGEVPAGCAPEWTLNDLPRAAPEIDERLLEAVEARVMPTDRLVIIHTSGSTSTPKGVIHGHGALIRHLSNLNEIRGYGPGDVMFSNSPLFWIGGYAFNLVGALVSGGTLAMSNALAASEVLDFLERERPGMTNGYPQSMARIGADPSFAARDFSFIRRGNLFPIMAPALRPRDPELRHAIYGMTETGSTLTISADEQDLPERYRGSFGRFAPGYEARIVDPESGRHCACGEVGELWVRGPFLMEGYYGRPRSQVFDADGWYHTGDLGALDEEGHFYFKGRRGDVIKTLGANVSPREVEAALRVASGDRQCLVVGVPDPERGQVVVGIVIAESDRDVDPGVLRAQLASKLSSYKIPRHILRLGQADLPMMSSGKIDARRLIALVADRLRERAER